MIETSNAQAASAPVSSILAKPSQKAATLSKEKAKDSEKQAVSIYTMPDNPMLPIKTEGLDIQRVGQTWVNPKGETKGRKSFVVKVPSKPNGLSGAVALAKSTELGLAIKPAIMGRVAAFAAHGATIVRRYSETPGKRKKLSLTLEQMVVETEIAKIARMYNMSEEEVAKRLSVNVNVKPEIAV